MLADPFKEESVLRFGKKKCDDSHAKIGMESIEKDSSINACESVVALRRHGLRIHGGVGQAVSIGIVN